MPSTCGQLVETTWENLRTYCVRLSPIYVTRATLPRQGVSNRQLPHQFSPQFPNLFPYQNQYRGLWQNQRFTHFPQHLLLLQPN